MPCWLLLLNDAGFPLFSRSYGLPSQAFSFPTMGLLSAVHSSAGNNGFAVTRMTSQDGIIRYRMFTGGLILVFSTSDIHMDDTVIEERMGLIYDALIFLIGRHKIQDLRNVERTKRQIRSAANLLSLFLVEDSYLLQMGTGIPECCLASNSQIFQHIRTLAKACNTLHAAFYAQHRLYGWTDEWAQLDSRDLFTISCFLRSATPAQARDVPVYLAHSSLGGGAATASTTGKTPYRLLTISLVHELELVLLCGPTPSLVDAMQIVQQTITTSTAAPTASIKSSSTSPPPLSIMHQDLLNGCIDFPRHLPHSFTFHPGILGFLFVWNQTPATSSDAQTPPRNQTRLVTSFLPTPPHVPVSPSSGPEKGVGRRSPSPSSAKKPAAPSHLHTKSMMEPPSPSQFAPNNPLFSSSLLSESSVLTRSHALLGFYHLMREELMPPPTHTPTTTSSEKVGDSTSASPPTDTTESSLSTATTAATGGLSPHHQSSASHTKQSTTNEIATTSEVYMLAPSRGFYGCRLGAHSLYVMFSEKIAQQQHRPLTWELMHKLANII